MPIHGIAVALLDSRKDSPMQISHDFGIGDTAEQTDNLAVQAAFDKVNELQNGGNPSAWMMFQHIFARVHADNLLAKYEQRWGPYVPNQAAQA